MKQLAQHVVEEFREHELFLRASAIAFQVLTAIVPFALFLIGSLGFFGLSETYSNEVAPKIQEAVSDPAFSLINQSLTRVLGGQHTFWATAGLALAIWQLSGAVRTAGATLDHLYDIEAEQPAKKRLPRSLWIAAAVAGCLTAAVAVTTLSPLIYGDVGWLLGALLFLARYALAALFLLLAIAVVVRHAPSERQRPRLVTGGAALVTVAWIVVSAAFGAYVTAIASYGSIYGVFASIVVLLAWTYASSLAFVAGIATDAGLRE